MNPEGRKALITGASRGLGLALARELARRGWDLVIDARGAGALEEARRSLSGGATVVAVPGDVSDPEHRRELTEAARSLGGLDAVVNNASTLGPSPQPELLDYPLAALEAVYRTNVVSPLALIQSVKEELLPQARIVNLTSDAAVEAYPGWGGYGPSKAALEHLSAILAAENPDLRVYHVDPGDMRTRMHQRAFPGEDISDRPLPEASVPGLVELLEGKGYPNEGNPNEGYPSGRYRAREIGKPVPADAPAGVRAMNVALTVRDFDAALTLYRDGLGLPVIDSWNEVGNGALLAAGGALLELLDETQAAEVDRVEAGERVSGAVRLGFEVRDAGSAAERLAAHGATPGSLGPVVTPWGHRNRRLQDPDGLQLTLFEPLSTEVEA